MCVKYHIRHHICIIFMSLSLYVSIYIYMCVVYNIYKINSCCICRYLYIYTYYGYSPARRLTLFFRTCHPIHRSCPRFTEVVLVSRSPPEHHVRVQLACGMDGSRWKLFRILSPICILW